MIIGPACATTIFGARKMYPGAVLWAGVRICTSGGFKSGREWYVREGGGFVSATVAVGVVCAGLAWLFFESLQPASRTDSTARVKRACLTRKSIDGSVEAHSGCASERTAPAVERAHRDPPGSAAEGYPGLEAFLRHDADGPELTLPRTCDQLPLHHVRRSVPADVCPPPAHGDDGPVPGPGGPVEAIGAVRVDAPTAEPPVEEDRAARPEFRET